MDDAFLSHVVFWIIGAITVLGGIGTLGAFIAMGRTADYKD